MSRDERFRKLLDILSEVQASAELLAVISAKNLRIARALRSELQELANEENYAATVPVDCSNFRDSPLTLKASETSNEPTDL